MANREEDAGMQGSLGNTHGASADGFSATVSDGTHDQEETLTSTPTTHHLITLPAEIRASILANLCLADLVSASMTCQTLYNDSQSDSLWRNLAQQHVPVRLTSPRPFQSFRDMYESLEPYWFLPKYKIWFSDLELTGRLVIVRFDQRLGSIEGYQLVAVNTAGVGMQPWGPDGAVVLNEFAPRVRLHLDKPILKLAQRASEASPRGNLGVDSLSITVQPGGSGQDVQQSTEGNGDQAHSSGSRRTRARTPYHFEVPMDIHSMEQMHSAFYFVRSSRNTESFLQDEYPYGNVWPPPTIPADERVVPFDPMSYASSPHLIRDVPRTRRQVSQKGFGIRKWFEMQFNGGLHLPHGAANFQALLHGANVIHVSEELSAYATLDPELYTPTPEKPYRGIWVGDYGIHGCEFLLIHQLDDDREDPFDPHSLVQGEDESDELFAQRKADSVVFRGRLEAIKLTGDPNVPRGERTFVADDLGEGGFVKTSEEPPFTGTRVVKSKGHIAREGFQDDEWIETELFLISHDRLAQHWVEYRHISYFQRINIDDFVGTNSS